MNSILGRKWSLPKVVAGDLDDIPAIGAANTRSDRNPIGKYPDNQKRMWAGYYATVTFMDQQVGRILDELERLDLMDSTAVIFTSDHGYHLGEHLFWQKTDLHEEVVRVPLIVSAPGFQPGRTRSLAELVDVYPTICQLFDVDVPNSVQGKSLFPVMKDPTHSLRSAALCEYKGHALRTADWAYMRYDDGSEELYDMQNDPLQFTNLAFAERAHQNQDTLQKMRQRLADRIEDLGIVAQRKKKRKKQTKTGAQ